VWYRDDVYGGFNFTNMATCPGLSFLSPSSPDVFMQGNNMMCYCSLPELQFFKAQYCTGPTPSRREIIFPKIIIFHQPALCPQQVWNYFKPIRALARTLIAINKHCPRP